MLRFTNGHTAAHIGHTSRTRHHAARTDHTGRTGTEQSNFGSAVLTGGFDAEGHTTRPEPRPGRAPPRTGPCEVIAILTNLNALRITVEGEVTTIGLPAEAPREGMYYAIGCHRVDVVNLTPELDMWLDDDGCPNGGINALATLIAHSFGCDHQAFYGTVVFTCVGDEGQTTALSPELAEHLRALAGAR